MIKYLTKGRRWGFGSQVEGVAHHGGEGVTAGAEAADHIISLVRKQRLTGIDAETAFDFSSVQDSSP